MINQDHARELAAKYVQKESESSKLNLCLIEEPILAGEYGWVFSYTTVEFLETKSIEFAIAGNAPLLIDKSTGALFVLGTAYPTEYYIDNYLEFNDPHATASAKIELYDYEEELIRPIDIIKLIRSESKLGLGKAREVFEECIDGRSQILELDNPEAAKVMVSELAAIGVIARRLPASS